MKKLIFATLLAMTLLTGCNRQILDTTWSFNYAIIDTNDGGHVEGGVRSWRDYENSDMLQIELEDGKTYLCHSSDVTLISK